jgi:PhnB protein
VADEPTMVPMLTYADGPAAMDWLVEAFGFTETARWLDDDGRLSHGELRLGDGLVMLASTPGYEGPAEHRLHCVAADAWMSVPWVIDGVLVHVGDVVAHRARAASAGATMLSEVEQAPFGALYRVEDPEGHRWMFMQPT